MITVGREYLELIKRLPLVPIRNDDHLKEANALVVELAIKDKKTGLSEGEADYFTVLKKTVFTYESTRFDFGPRPTPAELIAMLMEENGLTQVDMAPLFGGQSRVSDFLSGKRELSKTQIANLSKHFSLSPEALMPQTNQGTANNLLKDLRHRP